MHRVGRLHVVTVEGGRAAAKKNGPARAGALVGRYHPAAIALGPKMMSLLCAAISFVPTLRTPAPPAAARLPVVTMMERRAFALGAAALLSNAPFDLAAFADADGAAPISATTLLLAKEKKERPKKEKPPKKERPPKAKKEKKPKKEKAAPASAEAAPAEEQPNPEAEALRVILKETVGQKKY